MRQDKLRQIIDVVKNVPDADFNMNIWFRSGCGTVGCAIGWAIEKLGPDLGLFCRYPSKVGEVTTYGSVENRLGDRDYTAIAEVLDITDNEAFWLFSPLAYNEEWVRKVDVINRIQKFIDGERPPENVGVLVCHFGSPVNVNK